MASLQVWEFITMEASKYAGEGENLQFFVQKHKALIQAIRMYEAKKGTLNGAPNSEDVLELVHNIIWIKP